MRRAITALLLVSAVSYAIIIQGVDTGIAPMTGTQPPSFPNTSTSTSTSGTITPPPAPSGTETPIVTAPTSSSSGGVNPSTTATPVITNVPTSTADQNVSKWNIGDWNNHFLQNGMNTAIIGNTITQFANSDIGAVAFSGDPNAMGNDKVVNDSRLLASRGVGGSIGAFSDGLLNTVRQNALSNTTFSPQSWTKTFKCYITREIPISWYCPADGITHLGNINDKVDNTRKKCESSCYQQPSCINLEQNPSQKIDTPSGISATLTKNSPSASSIIAADQSRILDRITLREQKNSKFYYRVDYINLRNEIKTVISDFITDDSSLEQNRTFVFNDLAQSVTIKIYQKNPTTLADTFQNQIDISNIKLEYRINNRYICPQKQDITNIGSGDFSYQCPSGTIIQVPYTWPNGDVTTYRICKDGKNKGDNQDGTFSQKGLCENFCKKQVECVQKVNSVNTTVLQSFREGCMKDFGPNASVSDCSDTSNSCANARMSNTGVLNEIIFDAYGNSRKTIVGGSQIQGVDRPKVLLDSSVAFVDRSNEEWKDLAYKDMALGKKYNATAMSIGDDTNSSNAFAVNIQDIGSGAQYGYQNTFQKSVIWRLKPSANEVGSGTTNYYLYSVLAANIGYYGYDLDANQVHKMDSIWYIKTSSSDTFKPFRRGIDYYIKVPAPKTADDNLSVIKYTVNPSSSLDWSTFSDTTNSWTSFNASANAEYFATENFDAAKIWYEYPLVDNTNALINNLKGLAKSVCRSTRPNCSGTIVPNGPYELKIYTGTRNATGDSVDKYRVFNIYSPTQLTYSQIASMIDNSTVKPTYESGSENIYAKDVEDDGVYNNEIKIFMYGDASSLTSYTQIKPRAGDIGKKGFIYVFVY